MDSFLPKAGGASLSSEEGKENHPSPTLRSLRFLLDWAHRTDRNYLSEPSVTEAALVTAREGELHAIGLTKLFYLLHLSKPRADRTVYQTIRNTPVRSVLELGIGDGQRASRIIALASPQNDGEQVAYTGIDVFEAGSCHSKANLSLKQAYRQLRPLGAKLRLLPGDPMAVLPQVANTLGQFDLVVISAEAVAGQTPRAWFYLQRLLHPKSIVLVQEDGREGEFRRLSLAEIESRSSIGRARKAA